MKKLAFPRGEPPPLVAPLSAADVASLAAEVGVFLADAGDAATPLLSVVSGLFS